MINQGHAADYFYVVKFGEFTVTESGKKPHKLEGKSFGELALIYNKPRTATVKADTDAVLFRIDSQTFRHILAKNALKFKLETIDILKTIPMLNGLESHQYSKLADSIQIMPIKKGLIYILYMHIYITINYYKKLFLC